VGTFVEDEAAIEKFAAASKKTDRVSVPVIRLERRYARSMRSTRVHRMVNGERGILHDAGNAHDVMSTSAYRRKLGLDRESRRCQRRGRRISARELHGTRVVCNWLTGDPIFWG